MKVTEIRKYAREKGVDPGRMRKTELIRAIQAAENNPTCYKSERKYNCPESNCLWEEDCKKEK
ncbi:MAG: Rho termination factor N-terminal domain-containing protein [Candidatus Aminicenantes bacterium]|nr:Rho termination factor N-terminal domain-containing protein [Candidatus Aminicenantes bacterium]